MECIYHKSGYLNTDLDLFGEEPFDAIIFELGGSAALLHYRRETREEHALWFACIESRNSWNKANRLPQEDILSLIKIIKKMSPQAKAEWRGLRTRDFNIGWETQNVWTQQTAFTLSVEVLKELAAIHATCSVTIYPPSKEEENRVCENESLSKMQAQNW